MLELRKLYGLSKTKQRERLMGCIVYSPHWLQTTLSHIAKMGELYTYIVRGAFGVVSALVHSKTTIPICYLLDYQ